MALITTHRALIKPKAVASAAPVFPTLPGLVGRYNAQPGNFTQSLGNITGVTDLSGVGNNLTVNGTVPYNATSAINNHPAFDFGAGSTTGALINSAFSLNGHTGAIPFYIWFVVRPSASIGIFSTLGGYGSTSGNWGAGTVVSAATSNPATTFSFTSATVSGETLGANYRWGTAVNGALGTSDAEGFLNGSNVVTSNFFSESFTTGQTFGFGGGWTSGGWANFWLGPVCEVVVCCGTTFSSTNISQLDTYFTGTYGT